MEIEVLKFNYGEGNISDYGERKKKLFGKKLKTSSMGTRS